MDTTEITVTAELLRAKLQIVDRTAFENTLTHAPHETLEAILHRVRNGSLLEQNLYVDVFNVNQFRVTDSGIPEHILRKLNVTVLTSSLIDDIPWFGWDAVRATMTDALHAIPDDAVNLADMDAHRLRAAVLVNIVVDRSYRHGSYNMIVDYFEENFDAIYACLPALVKRHEGLGEINVGLVKEIAGGIPLAVVDGVL